MAEQTESAPEHESRAAVQITAIIEFFRAIRWAIVVGGVVLCVWVAANAVVDLFAQPPWLILSIVVLSGVAPSGIPIWIVIKLYRSRIKVMAKRIAELEKSVNPTRSSSDLRPDGTLPHD